MELKAIFGGGSDHWVCPNDRQLALRAKLRTGWSVHTFRTDIQKKTQMLNEQELDVILSVINRAEKLEQVEQLRIGRLVERLDNMRQSSRGNGLSQCVLCGEVLGLLGTSSVYCLHCCKKVCTKCAIETTNQKKPQWLCKICSEQREVWKRSGAWFFKALPKYLRPEKEMSIGAASTPRTFKRGIMNMARSTPLSHTFTWAHGKVVSSDSDSDSDSESDQSEDSVDSKMSNLAAYAELRKNSASSGGLAVRSQTSLLSESHSSLSSEYSLLHPAALFPEDYDTDRSSTKSPLGQSFL